jgi:hypothetical protein
MLVKCPKCGSDDTYASALYMGWRCQNPECNNVFQIDEAAVDKPSTERKTKTKASSTKSPKGNEQNLKLQVGDFDGGGNRLAFREKIKDIYYDIWETPGGRKYIVGIPKTDSGGKVIGRFTYYTDAIKCLRTYGYEGEDKQP